MFNWLDYLIISFMLIGAVFGILRGYRWELYRTGCLIVAAALSIFFHDAAGQFVPERLKSGDGDIFGYTIIFLATLMATFPIGILILRKRSGNPDDSRFLGGLCGLLKNAILCSIIIIGLHTFGNETTQTQIDSARIAATIHQTISTTINKIQKNL